MKVAIGYARVHTDTVSPPERRRAQLRRQVAGDRDDDERRGGNDCKAEEGGRDGERMDNREVDAWKRCAR